MKCDVCKAREGKRYIAFPEEKHDISEVEILSLCPECKPKWYKQIPQSSRSLRKHWVLRSTTIIDKMRAIPIPEDRPDLVLADMREIDVPLYELLGHTTDEEDETI